MPAIKRLAGMARSYRCLAKSFSDGCPAISFTDKWLTQKVCCIQGARINQHAIFRFMVLQAGFSKMLNRA
jgi:hypothetical protein